jgi:hypothetical protein
VRAVRWSETNLELHGYTTTEWQLLYAPDDGDTIVVRIGSDVFRGWAEWRFVAQVTNETVTFSAGVRGEAEDLDRPLVVTFASYGVPGKEADVRERLTELIDDQWVLDVEATLAYLLVDPAPGEFKTLHIRWSENGIGKASAFLEGTHVVIPDSASEAS